MTKVMAGSRRFRREEEIAIPTCTFLANAWLLVWKHAEGGERKEKSLSHSPGVSTPKSHFSHVTYTMFDCASAMCRQLSCSIRRATHFINQRSNGVSIFVSRRRRKPRPSCALDDIFDGLTSAPQAWWLDITKNLSQLSWTFMSTDQCLRCRYADGGSKQGVLCINVDDFLIGLSHGVWVKMFV